MANFSNWAGKKVFVTGAGGFIGSALTEALQSAGADAICLLRDEPAVSSFDVLGLRGKVTIVHGSVEDLPLLERVLAEYEVDTVFHLAAQTLVGVAAQSPLSTFEANIRGTWNLLEACRTTATGAGRVQRIIVASSDKAYGPQRELPYREDFPLRPQFPYDVSKACAEMLAGAYFHTWGLPVAITRCANIYGPGDLNWSRIVPGTIRSALKGERPILRSDGSPVRDYLYVDDAVAAYLALGAAVGRDAGAAGSTFNFGTDRPVPVLEITRVILAAAERPDLEPDIRGTAQAEIDRQYLDSTKARTGLGWRAQVNLEEGLRRTVGWYRQHAAEIGIH
jgi:CDP-glucose 4,6-dehydratase